MSCKDCYWLRLTLDDKKLYKCKLHMKRFNHPMLHGFSCKSKVIEVKTGVSNEQTTVKSVRTDKKLL